MTMPPARWPTVACSSGQHIARLARFFIALEDEEAGLDDEKVEFRDLDENNAAAPIVFEAEGEEAVIEGR